MNKRIKRKLIKKYAVTDEILKHAVKTILNRIPLETAVSEEEEYETRAMVWDWRSNQASMCGSYHYDTIELSTLQADTVVMSYSPKLTIAERKALYNLPIDNIDNYHIRACAKAIIERYDQVSRPRKMNKSAMISIRRNNLNGIHVIEYDFDSTMIVWQEEEK